MIDYENLNKVNSGFEHNFRDSLNNFLKSGKYILDDEVVQFENEFAAYCGSKYCVGVASGFDALYLSLLALHLPSGSEVLVPSNTYIATIFSILNAGLKPILVEPKITTYNIDPERIKHHLSRRTKAIIVVHLYGKPCEMDAIKAVAEEYGVELIEDCAQAHGATFQGKKVGTFGVMGAFSFYPTKNLGALGDAGGITTDNEMIAEELRALRNYGSEKKYYNKYIGINSRLDELQAAFLRIKLQHLDVLNSHKARLATIYLRGIQNESIILPVVKEGIQDVWHIFNIRCDRRDDLRQHLLENGIKTEIHYPQPPHQQTACLGVFEGLNYPISEEIHRTTLSLPISLIHTKENIEYISDILSHYQV